MSDKSPATPKESILRSFEMGDIARYFPEYGETFAGRAASG